MYGQAGRLAEHDEIICFRHDRRQSPVCGLPWEITVRFLGRWAGSVFSLLVEREGGNPDFVFLFNPVESSGSASVDSDLSRSDPAMEDAVRQIETPGQKLQKLLARFGVGDDKRFGHGRLA